MVELRDWGLSAGWPFHPALEPALPALRGSGLVLFVPQPLPLQLLPSLNVFRLLPLSEPHRLRFTDCLALSLQPTHFPEQLAVDDLSISSADFNTLSNLLAFFFFF